MALALCLGGLGFSRPASAEEAPALSPAMLEAMKERQVVLRLSDGREIAGQVLGVGETIVLAQAPFRVRRRPPTDPRRP